MRPGNAQFGVVATFDDQAGLQSYLTDPRHVAVIEEAGPLVSERHAVQFGGESPRA